MIPSGEGVVVEAQPFATVVICTKNRKECLKKYSLSSVLALDYPRYEVLVVDDASSDGTAPLVSLFQSTHKNLRVVRNAVSLGASRARQAGVEHARGAIIAFTDDDCLVSPAWLSELIGVHAGDPEMMAVGGFAYDRDTGNPYLTPGNIFGFNMSFRREVFLKFKFDPNLFFHRASMHEETDLVERMKRHGLKTGYAPKAIVRHFCAPADYRKINRRLGDHLNWIYMKAKAMPPGLYYLKFFKRSYQMGKIIRQLRRERVFSLVDVLKEMVWVNAVLLFGLPIKAKLAHRREEKMFKGAA